MNDNEQLTLEKLHNFVVKNKVSNDFLVELIIQTGSYLNLQTIPDYAKSNNMTYSGVKRFRTIVELFNNKYVIDKPKRPPINPINPACIKNIIST